MESKTEAFPDKLKCDPLVNNLIGRFESSKVNKFLLNNFYTCNPYLIPVNDTSISLNLKMKIFQRYDIIVK